VLSFVSVVLSTFTVVVTVVRIVTVSVSLVRIGFTSLPSKVGMALAYYECIVKPKKEEEG